LGGPSTSRLEQPHLQERHHTLTQNLKAMGLWVLLLIRCLINLYSFIRCGTYNSHLYKTTLPLKCESFYSSCSPFKRKLLLYMYRRCWFLRKRTDTSCTTIAAFYTNGPAASVAPFIEPGSNTTVGSIRGAWGTVHIEARTTTLLVPPLLLSTQRDRLPRSHPSSNRALIPLLGQLGELGGLSTSRLEQPHLQERHHTLTQNLKAIGLWALLFIRCSTFILLSDVGHITHTCTQQQV